jgi:hypothetical protein
MLSSSPRTLLACAWCLVFSVIYSRGRVCGYPNQTRNIVKRQPRRRIYQRILSSAARQDLGGVRLTKRAVTCFTFRISSQSTKNMYPRCWTHIIRPLSIRDGKYLVRQQVSMIDVHLMRRRPGHVAMCILMPSTTLGRLVDHGLSS